jgi:endonuclease/exonuclease/phosphatase family metal-dependent hydrolase
MSSLRVTTWNVLHRVHAVNWGEEAIEGFTDESIRIARISETVRGWLASGTELVCLQEVSGDQLVSLRACAGNDITVAFHRYPRVPRCRGAGDAGLVDPTEHLVTLSVARDTRAVAAETFASDPGKGFLAVQVAGVRVVCTHVTHGASGHEQLARLAAFAREGRAPTVIVGDFNADAAAVQTGLGEGFVLADLTREPPTRAATETSHARTIDHVAVLDGEIAAVRVHDREGLSDHAPVGATVTFDRSRRC